MLGRTVRHQQSMLKIKIYLCRKRPVESLLQQISFLRMSSLQHPLQGRLSRSIEFKDLVGFIGPVDETYKIFEFDRAAKPTLEWVLERTHPEERDLLQQTLDRSLATEIDFDFEHRLLMPDGSTKHVHALARVVKTSSGTRGFVGTVTDITERKRTEEALR